jgi:hypothetical protein
LQGAAEDVVDGLADGDLTRVAVSPAELALLEFVRKVTFEAPQVTGEDTEGLRKAGWTDEQLAEAVYVAALFAFFNRVADAFGLANAEYRQPRPKSSPDRLETPERPDIGNEIQSESREDRGL